MTRISRSPRRLHVRLCWRLPPRDSVAAAETLTVAEGVITDRRGHKVRYEELIGSKQFSLQLNKAAKRRSSAEWTVLGKPVRALETTELMTGRFEFVQHVRVPGMAHGRVVRPPQMGATVAHVDEASVNTLPGNVRVVVRKNFVGVVAEKQHHAVNAARQLKVTWNPGPNLPPQAEIFEYLKHQPSRDQMLLDSGDVEAQLGAAAKVVHASYTFPYQMHGSVGTSCAVADVKADSATVWSSTQSAYPTRSIIAKLLNLPPDNVRVIYTRGSGCYGLNGADAVSFDAAVLSQAVGQPVRLQFSREDEMLWENLGSACLMTHRAALGPDGLIAAWDREDWVATLGNRPGYDRPGNVVSGMLLGYEPEPFSPGPAKQPEGRLRNGSNTVPNYMTGCIAGKCNGGGKVRSERVLTHTVRSPFFTGPLRSPLRIQNTFANECFMDELCAAAHADPVAFRLQHLTDERLIGVIHAAARAAQWQTRSSRPSPLAGDGVVSGRGFSCVAYEGQNGYAALVADVHVDLRSAQVRPKRFVLAIDCGPVSNPDGLRNQIEGGILQGMSRSLVEEVTWDSKRITSVDWVTYRSLYLDIEVPSIETVFVTPPGVRATGAGETSITVTPAAIANAIYDATGARVRDVPFTPERVRAAIEAARTNGGASV